MEMDLTQTSYSTIPSIDIELETELPPMMTRRWANWQTDLWQGEQLLFHRKFRMEQK